MDLRGGSAEALTALTERLDGATGTNRAAAALGDELFTVSQLFRSEPGLRRFATDASLAPEAKQGMVQQVFADRLSDSTLALLTDAVGRRWTFSRDLPDVLERLSEMAVVRSRCPLPFPTVSNRYVPGVVSRSVSDASSATSSSSFGISSNRSRNS